MGDFKNRHPGVFRFFYWVFGLSFAFIVAKYSFEVNARLAADKNPEGWWTEVETVQGVVYTAKQSFIHRHTILLRLYRAGDPTLLAERTYSDHGVGLSWSPYGWLIYDTSDTSYENGFIQLPPTWIDGFLAKLP